MFTREQQIARVFKALGDENRIVILEKLQSGEMCACWLLEELKIGQSTLSHHMRVLADADIVNCRREGKWVYYSLSETGSQHAQALLSDLLTPRPGDPRPSCCDK